MSAFKIHWNRSDRHIKPDKRFLIGVLIFGILYAATGSRWLSEGSIVIREGGPRSGGQVDGIIQKGDALFYPVCAAWILLGSSMVALTPLACFTARGIFLRLAAYSCLMVILLGFGTVAAAMWNGP